MIIAAKLKKFLDQYRISYQVFSHEKTVTLFDAQKAMRLKAETIVRTVMLKDEQGYVLVALPLTRQLDFSHIHKKLKRKLKIASRQEVDGLYCDCEPGSHPPFGEPYGVKMIIDAAIFDCKHIYFEPGTHTSMVRMSIEDFQFLTQGAMISTFACPFSQNEPYSDTKSESDCLKSLVELYNPCLDDIANRIQATYPLPPLPTLAEQLMLGALDGSMNATKLSHLIRQEPLLVEWAQSFEAHFAKEKLTPACMAQALGALLACRTFKCQKKGPLGSEAVWKEALMSATLCYKLAPQRQLEPDLAFACGLYHNFGYLVFGHLFGPEFCLLNRMRSMRPACDVIQLEKKILGMGVAQKICGQGHTNMGAWLLQAWQLPEAVITSAKEHHNPVYQGAASSYLQLLGFVKQQLKLCDIGDDYLQTHAAKSPHLPNQPTQSDDLRVELMVSSLDALPFVLGDVGKA